MRGEYKVPGGKLVAVEIETQGGGTGDRITEAFVSGDFFLEPDEALEDINGALLGLDVDSSVDDIATAIRQRLSDDVSLIGFSPEAVGIAVRRALGKASSWEDHHFDLIGR